MVLVNLGFHTRKNLSENNPQFGHAFSKIFSSPVLGRKSLKNIGLKWRRIIRLPGASTSLRPALAARSHIYRLLLLSSFRVRKTLRLFGLQKRHRNWTYDNWRVKSSGMWHCVERVVADVSSSSRSSSRRKNGKRLFSLTAWSWRWRSYHLSKRRQLLAQRHGVTSPKIPLWTPHISHYNHDIST
jgi:hypothetical protein